MQYTVRCGCGHTQALQLYGPMAERERRLAWMRSPEGLCNSCYAARKRADEQAGQEAAIQAAMADILRRAREAGMAEDELRQRLAEALPTATNRVYSEAARRIVAAAS